MRSDTLVWSFHFFNESLAGQGVMLISLVIWLYAAALFWLVGAFYWRARGDRD